MSSRISTSACLIVATLLIPAGVTAGGPSARRLPLSFEPNAGQFDARARFALRTERGAFFFGPTGITLATPEGRPLQMSFLGALPDPRMEGGVPQPATVSYFRGRDPKGWQTGVATFSEVRYSELYPGVSLVYGANGRPLKGTYTVAAGADPGRIRWTYDGGRPTVDADGRLHVHTPHGTTLTEDAPIAWQEDGEGRVPVAVRFTVNDGTVGFELDAYDRTRALTIDPVIEYSTYLGGSIYDIAWGMAVDLAGNVYVAGYTASSNFPTLDPYQPSAGGQGEAFVAKFRPDGSPQYITYLGGDYIDYGTDIAVDLAGNAYVTGWTGSSDFPVTPGSFQPQYAGGWDAFVTKLNATGTALVYSSYLGGSGQENRTNAGIPGSIAVDRDGNAYVAGDTLSADFPTVHALQPSLNGSMDAYVTKVNAEGTSLVYSTYLGGERAETAWGIAVDRTGNAVVVGDTTSLAFPVVNAHQPNCAPSFVLCHDVFVTRIDARGAVLVYSTYLGGADRDYIDRAFGVAVDDAGAAYVTGMTGSLNFPLMNQIQSYGGQIDAFISVFAPGGALRSSTYWGGENSDVGYGIAVDPPRSNPASIPLGIHVTGLTISTGFPRFNPMQNNLGGFEDPFVAKFRPDMLSVLYSTYLGGTNGREEYGALDIGVDALGNVYIAGGTAASDYPVADPYQATPNGSYDVFVTKLGQDEAGVDDYSGPATGRGRFR